MTNKKPAPLATVESELRRVLANIQESEKIAVKDDADKLKEDFLRESEKREQRDTNDMRQVLMRADGRRVVYRIIEEAKTFAASFALGHSDLTAYNEGQRNIGMFVMKLAEMAEPGVCLRMAREYDSDKTSQDARQKKIMEENNA